MRRLQGRFQRLFHQHVLSGLGGGDGHLRVVVRWGPAPAPHPLPVRRQLAVVGVPPRRAVFFREGAGALRVPRADRGEARPLDELQLAGAAAARHPGADQPESQRPPARRRGRAGRRRPDPRPAAGGLGHGSEGIRNSSVWNGMSHSAPAGVTAAVSSKRAYQVLPSHSGMGVLRWNSMETHSESASAKPTRSP